MKSVATRIHTSRTVTFRGGEYVASLMAELSRVGIAQRIQQARQQAGLTQQELADALHVHRNTVQNWESQKKPITPWDQLGEIANWTQVSRDWLIHGDHQEADPRDALRVRVVDSLRGLEESQEDVLAKLDEYRTLLGDLAAAVSRLEDLLSTQPAPLLAPGTAAQDSTLRPQ